MLLYVTRRVFAVVPLLVIVAAVAFGLVFLTPGDAAVAVAGESATPERIEEIRQELGLDEALHVQFGRWASGAVRGDFGNSLYSDIPVMEQIAARVGPSFALVVFGLAFALVLGIPAGLVAGLRRGSVVDRAVTTLTTAGIAMPAFWLATILLIVFSVDRNVLPATGYVPFFEDPAESLRHLLLPALAIGAASAAEIARQTRSGVIDVADQDFIRTSRAMGLSHWSVVFKHILKNAGIPIVTVVGLQVGRILGAGVVVEQMFAIPGLGQLTVQAVQSRDMPQVQALVVVIAGIVLVANLVVDASYAFFNPKLRHA